ncbi:hypothetical protein [Enterobacter hormaechei]|uniref:hypothetical protein n=1 Tax=Enterobacter hormaechei TaxID=158836 RepID=UPI0032EE924A
MERHATKLRTGLLFVRFQAPADILRASGIEFFLVRRVIAGAVQAAPDAGFMGGNQMQAFLYRLRQGGILVDGLVSQQHANPFYRPAKRRDKVIHAVVVAGRRASRAVKQAGKDDIDGYALVGVFIPLFLTDIFQQTVQEFTCQGSAEVKTEKGDRNEFNGDRAFFNGFFVSLFKRYFGRYNTGIGASHQHIRYCGVIAQPGGGFDTDFFGRIFCSVEGQIFPFHRVKEFLTLMF